MNTTGSKMHGDPCRAVTVPVIAAGLENNGPTDTPLIDGEQIGKRSHCAADREACDD